MFQPTYRSSSGLLLQVRLTSKRRPEDYLYIGRNMQSMIYNKTVVPDIPLFYFISTI